MSHNPHEEPIQLTDDDHIADDDGLLAGAIPIDQLTDTPGSDTSASDTGDPATSRDEHGHEVMDLIDDGEQDIKRDIRVTAATDPRHEDNWNRTPNVTGQGAIHVKTFVAKLRLDAIAHLDQSVNEWLDAHPQYEVKMVTSNVGELVGKTREQALFVNVWV